MPSLWSGDEAGECWVWSWAHLKHHLKQWELSLWHSKQVSLYFKFQLWYYWYMVPKLQQTWLWDLITDGHVLPEFSLTWCSLASYVYFVALCVTTFGLFKLLFHHDLWNPGHLLWNIILWTLSCAVRTGYPLHCWVTTTPVDTVMHCEAWVLAAPPCNCDICGPVDMMYSHVAGTLLQCML